MRASGMRLRPAALVEVARNEDLAGLEVDAIVGQRDGLGEAEADGAAEGHEPLDRSGSSRGEPRSCASSSATPSAGS